MQSNIMRGKKRIIEVLKEGRANLDECRYIENIQVAYNQQILLTTKKMEDLCTPLNIIAKQHKLNLHFYKKVSDAETHVMIKYDIIDMMMALDLLEKSIMEN